VWKLIKISDDKAASIAAFSFLSDCKRVALSLGRTYRSIYSDWARRIREPTIEFFPVDERMVPLDHPDSNWGAINHLLFEPTSDTRSLQNFATSATDYTALLRKKFQSTLPVFDAVFLGMGSDGHTASLFPMQPVSQEEVVLETTHPDHPHHRITLGPKTLIQAERLILVVTGTDKKPLLPRLLSLDPTLPISEIVRKRSLSVLIVQETLLASPSTVC